jgi:CheY-like chemotaxis protein
MVTSAQPAKRILLIDDDFILREMVTLTLAGQGYMVATAANGEDAFQRLRNFELPNLILLDLMLPRMDGWRFRAEQKRDPELASIPVVIFSAVGDIEKNASSLEARGYLQKPVPPEKLLETIRRCCS